MLPAMNASREAVPANRMHEPAEKCLEQLFLVTIDCDLRAPSIDARDNSLRALCDVFEEAGIADGVTWFLNENDFAITEHHAAFMDRILSSGAGIGVHDHLDKFKRPLRAEHVLPYCRRSKERVERFLSAHGRRHAVRCHRNGCLTQDPEIYRALAQLGYTVHSDVYPGSNGQDHARHEAFDNRQIPPGIRPYRHNEASYLDFRTSIALGTGDFVPFEGDLLQIPVFHMGLDLDFAGMDRWVRTAEEIDHSEPSTTGRSPIVMTWLFHPYEILDNAHGEIAEARVALLREKVRELVKRGQRFIDMETLAGTYDAPLQ